MSVYEDQFKAFQSLHKVVLTEVMNNGKELDKDKLIYEITLAHPVSEKVIEKRIAMLLKAEPSIRLKDGILMRDDL